MGLVSLVTRYLFIENAPEKADVILVPGCPFPEPMERAARLYHDGFSKLLLPSGNCWIFHKRGGERLTECEMMARAAALPAFPILRFCLKSKARHTLDNARLSLIALDNAGVTVKTAIICCQSFHARRCLKAYGKHFNGVKLIVCPVPTRGFNAASWHKSPVGVFKVCTELLKCSGLFFFLISFVKSR